MPVVIIVSNKEKFDTAQLRDDSIDLCLFISRHINIGKKRGEKKRNKNDGNRRGCGSSGSMKH